jgi:hypothetical protein
MHRSRASFVKKNLLHRRVPGIGPSLLAFRIRSLETALQTPRNPRKLKARIETRTRSFHMRSIISRWFMFGLLVGWALTHTTVFGQDGAGKAATPADKLRAKLDKAITVDYTGQSMVEVLNHLREKIGVSINIDQLAFMQMPPDMPGGQPAQVTIRATNEKASSVLRKLLGGHQLAYVIIDDALLVTSEDSAVMRQMRQRVSVDLDEVPFKKAVRDLAKTYNINLVIDPAVMKSADKTVSLQVDNTGIETAVRLLSELASLKAVRMGNVMYITSDEKAKKIRDEEQHQFDNPLNLNLPVGPPMIRGGFAGGGMGGFGGVPLQGIVPNQAPMIVPPATPRGSGAP